MDSANELEKTVLVPLSRWVRLWRSYTWARERARRGWLQQGISVLVDILMSGDSG